MSRVVKVIVPHFYPEVNALTNRLASFLPELAKGNDVKIFYLLSEGEEFDEGTLREIFSGSRFEFFPVKQISYDRSSSLKRLIGETFNSIKLWVSARKQKSDVLFVSVPIMMLLPVSGVFARLDRASVKILELRDLTWEYLDFGRGVVGRAISVIVKWVAVNSIKAFTRVAVCTTEQAAFVSQNAGIIADIVRNGVSDDKFSQLKLVESRRAEDFTISYFGTLGVAQNLMMFVKAAEILKEVPSIKFRIVGDGTDEKILREYISSNVLENIEIKGKVNWEQLLEFYKDTDALYAQLRGTEGLAKAEPSKLFEYFSTGKHVLYGGYGLGGKLAGEFENATVIPPDNPQVLADSILKLSKIQLGKNHADIEKIETHFVRENIFRSYLEKIGLV